MMIKTKSKYKKAFTMVELMLLLVVFSLILASSFSVITRKHKLKPTRALHGEYLCYNGDISEFKDKDGNSYSGTGNIEIYYQGNSEVRRGVTANGGQASCDFQLPSNATYYLVRMVGGGGAGGNANYAPIEDITSIDSSDNDIHINLIKEGGGEVKAFQPITVNQMPSQNFFTGINKSYAVSAILRYLGLAPNQQNSAFKTSTGISEEYVDNAFSINGVNILTGSDTFKDIVNDFFGQNFSITAYDYAGSGQSGIKISKIRGLEERDCKLNNYRGNMVGCFNQYVKDIGLVTNETGTTPHYMSGCVAIGNGELTDVQLEGTQQEREEKLARYCPIFFNDYWIPSQNQGNFHMCEGGKGGRGAMISTAINAGVSYEYNLTAAVGNRFNIDFGRNPVQNYRYDTAPSIKNAAITPGTFSECNNPNTNPECITFTEKNGSPKNLIKDRLYTYVPQLNGAEYKFNLDFSYPNNDLMALQYNQRGENMNPRAGGYPYFARNNNSTGVDSGISWFNRTDTAPRTRILLFFRNGAGWNARNMGNSPISSEAGEAGTNLTDPQIKSIFCTNTTDTVPACDILDHCQGGVPCEHTCNNIGEFKSCPATSNGANGTINVNLGNQLSQSLCIANLRFYAPHRNLNHLRANLKLRQRYRNPDTGVIEDNPNIINDDDYDHHNPDGSQMQNQDILMPFQCRPFSEPNNVYRNAGFRETPEPLSIGLDEFALSFRFLHNNKIMTYALPGNPGEYREFYTRATSSNRLYIRPGQGGEPYNVTKEQLSTNADDYNNFLNRLPESVKETNHTYIFFNCRENEGISAGTCQNHIAHGGAGGRSGLLETKDELIYSQDVAGKIAQRLAQGNLGEHPFPRYSYNASIDKDESFFEKVKDFVGEYISNRQGDGARTPGAVLYNPDAGKGAQTRFSIISDLLNIPNMEGAISNFGKGGDAGYGWDDCWIGQRVLLLYMPELFEDYMRYPGSNNYAYVKGTHFSQLTNNDISACKTGDSWWGNEPGEIGGGGAVLITW